MDLADRYRAAAWLEAEHDRLWPRVWLLLAPAAMLRDPGASVVLDHGRDAVFAVRGDDGVLRAFHNACPHRGHRLCDQSPVPAALTCPYHQWTFGRDGRFRAGPGGVPGADLLAARVEERHGLVFVAVSDDAPDLDAFLAPVAPRFAAWDLGTWSVRADVSVEVACNWKASVDAHSEAYHVPLLHPEAKGRVRAWDARYEALGVHGCLEVPVLPADTNTLLFLFPNVHLNRHGDSLMLFRHRPHATDPGRCTFDEIVLAPGSGARPQHRHTTAGDPAIGPVTAADLRIVEGVQRGLTSRAFRTPALTDLEPGLRHFQESLAAYVGDVPP